LFRDAELPGGECFFCWHLDASSGSPGLALLVRAPRVQCDYR
jgi:hypothetical protein